MKVGKEEIVGMLVAIERFLSLDHAAEWRVWEKRVAEMIEILSRVPGMTARVDVPEIANHSPHLVVEWSQWHSTLKADDVVRRLREGDPPIAVLGEGEGGLRVAVWTLRDDEHRLIANHIQQLFSGSTILSAFARWRSWRRVGVRRATRRGGGLPPCSAACLIAAIRVLSSLVFFSRSAA